MTVHTQAVLHALLAYPEVELYGLEIARRTDLLPGTAYPILSRLTRVGWATDRWEDVDPHDRQRPRRRYYRLTEDGAAAAREALRQVDPAFVRNAHRWLDTDPGVEK